MLFRWVKSLFCILLLAGSSIYGQTVVCGGKTIKVDRGRTMFASSKDCKSCKNYILNDKALDFKKPERPFEPQLRKSSGSVSLIVSIDRKGKVVNAKAVSGPLILREISKVAVKNTLFKRLIYDCRPSKYSGVFTINYPPE